MAIDKEYIFNVWLRRWWSHPGPQFFVSLQQKSWIDGVISYVENQNPQPDARFKKVMDIEHQGQPNKKLFWLNWTIIKFSELIIDLVEREREIIIIRIIRRRKKFNVPAVRSGACGGWVAAMNLKSKDLLQKMKIGNTTYLISILFIKCSTTSF